MRKGLFILVFVCISCVSYATQVKGVVKNKAGTTIPFVSIHVGGIKSSWSTNSNGEFSIVLKPGTYTFTFSSIGYKNLEKPIEVLNQSYMIVNLTMDDEDFQLEEVLIHHNGRDRAKEIMKEVRDKRKDYLNAAGSFKSLGYMKISTLRENLKWNEPDSADMAERKKSQEKKKKKWFEKNRDTTTLKYFRDEESKRFKQIHLIEAYGQVNYDGGDQYTEKITAWNDNKLERIDNGHSLNISVDIGEHEIAPLPDYAELNYVLFQRFYPVEFQFYRNLVDVPAVSNKPILSPIAATSALHYRYDFTGQYEVDGKKIYEIYVSPLYKTDALFRGKLFIEDSTWALLSVDLWVNEPALLTAKNFRIIQHYQQISPGCYMPSGRHMQYEFKYGSMQYTTEQHFEHMQYEMNPVFEKNTFGNEVRKFEEGAYDFDSSFWAVHRPVELTSTEQKYLKRNDSLETIYESEEFMNAMDSAYNHIDIWNVLLMGIGHRNRYRGYSYMIDPIIMQLNPFGIGGYRHKLGLHFNKEFKKNGWELDTDGQIDYGFRNKDVKGKLGVGLMYVPKKFVRTYITVGDYYDMVNTYASIGTVFSRSNYVRTQTITIAQRMEILNGLYGELTFDFSDQKPITNLAIDQWSQQLFGSNNTPVDFQRYIKSEVKMELKYRIKQKYVIKKNKKVVLGSKYPTVQAIYRKGIPGLFNSEVNFDYIELGVKDDARVGRLGTSNWSFQMGSFVNRSSLRVLENKYFRGSDPFFFSDPVRSFQLLGPTLNTNSEFLRANIIHHFDGAVLSKIPFLNRLKINLAGGAGTLVIPEYDFRHAEVFAGIERITRIRRGLFRFGVYAVTADNNLSKADWTIKFGINFYNSYTNRWEY